ncbi:class I histocompatibility antigen, F10 alpha chain-like [Xyrauchen texanus]|uniref:class I histocompatibility antigen, F10 alpha chain-like n=1 Tax=Xyrauchen texanus TaxID=154827 RepID=UPI002241A806|nr:class I histocompatibility antigen, F10 alpha chain-like [Xyrauchen texanus]
MIIFSTVLTDSHFLWMFATYIEGEMPFSDFSVTFMLDDITVGHYNSEILRYVPRGNTTNEDDAIDVHHMGIISRIVHQVMNHCELGDDDKPVQVLSESAFRGSTSDEKNVSGNILTYNGTEHEIKPYMLSMWCHETLYYPDCITVLKTYHRIRNMQIKRKVTPEIRLIQKASTDSGGSWVNCLATGLCLRHINLTLFRDGQPVSDHEITGGDLLPNVDGTYQMRKSLEISAEEQRERTQSEHQTKYQFGAFFFFFFNMFDVSEFYPGDPFQPVIPPLLTDSALVLVFGIGANIFKYRCTGLEHHKHKWSDTISKVLMV